MLKAFGSNPEPVIVTVPTPGQLEESLLYCDESSISHLIIKGTLNGSDLKLINNPHGVLLTVDTLDLSEIECIEDESTPYSSVSGIGSGSNLYRFYYSSREEVVRTSDDPDWSVSGTDKFSWYTTSLAALIGEKTPYKEVFMPVFAKPNDYALAHNKNIERIVYKTASDKIGYAAFFNCEKLTSIEIPGFSDIKEIGGYAFSECAFNDFSTLIPEKIGAYAFYNNALQTMDLSSLTELGEEAFVKSKITGGVNLSNLKSIPRYAFYCTGISGIILGNMLESIGDNAFNSTKLSEVKLPESLISLGEDAFNFTPYLNDALKSQGYENGVFYLEKFAYKIKKDEIPTKVVIKDGTVGICGKLFYNSNLDSYTVTLPSSIKTIGAEAFCSTKIEEINLPEGLVKIGGGAFASCKGLKYINLPQSLEYLGDGAFSGCSKLTEISLGSNIKGLSDGTFGDCDGITKVYYNVPDAGEEIISIKYAAKIIVGPDVRFLPRISDSKLMILEFEPRSDDQPIKMYSIGQSNLKSIVLPQTLEGIPERCFGGSESLESVTFASSPVASEFYIEERAFSECVSLKSFEIPENTKYIGNWAFWKSGLESINLPMGLRYIGSAAFYGCLNDQEMLVIPYTLEVFDDGDYRTGSAFDNIGVRGITVPGNLLDRSDLILNCPNLESLIIEKGVETLAIEVKGPFKTFDVPDNITKISGYFNSDGVKDVVLPDGLREISGNLIFGNMESMSLPVSCLSISGGISGVLKYSLEWRIPEDYKYEGSTEGNIIRSLGSVGNGKKGRLVIPEGVEQFGYNLSDDYPCGTTTSSHLYRISLPSTLKRIYNQAFAATSIDITCYAENPPEVYGGYMYFFSSVHNRNLIGTVTVPEKSVESYEKNPAWGKFTVSALPNCGITEVKDLDYNDIKDIYTLSGFKVDKLPNQGGMFIVVFNDGTVTKIRLKQ